MGNALGSVFGSWLRTRGSEVIITTVLLLATVAAAAAAIWYGLLTVVVVAATAGMAASLGKLALDALIQRDVPRRSGPRPSPARRPCSSCPGWPAGWSASRCR